MAAAVMVAVKRVASEEDALMAEGVSVAVMT
jgi:hypothetical protein